MPRPETPKLRTWMSKGKRITYAPQHQMYIVDHPDGRWHNINTSEEIMLAMNPIDVVPNKKKKV